MSFQEQEIKAIQGTDGIRGKISYTNPSPIAPLLFFQEKRLLTPYFFQEYVYVFGRLLQKQGLAKQGDTVVIGEDPRDKKGVFIQAAINGLAASGLQVITVGILPTPAVVHYMLAIKAKAAVMLTASHNPADQHGIKLFFGSSALKFFPYDDILLTEELQKFSGSSDSQTMLLQTYTAKKEHEKARRLFIATFQDERNTNKVKDTSNAIVVIDAANGAASSLVADLFCKEQFAAVYYENVQGNINENSGVAALEGHKSLTKQQALSSQGLFSAFPLWRRLAQLADDPRVKQDLQPLIAFVFDGDADRCYRIDYIHGKQTFYITNGDLLACQISRYKMAKANLKQAKETVCVCTIESDINLSLLWQKQGFQVKITSVGDKWILQNAFLSQVKQVEEYITNEEGKHIYTQLIQSLQEEAISAIKVTRLWQDMQTYLESYIAKPGHFLVGAEESGHIIVPSYVKTIDQKEIIGYVGNGIQTALLSLYSAWNQKEAAFTSWHVNLPVYYVDKSFLTRFGIVYNTLAELVTDSLKQAFIVDSSVSVKQVIFPQEPNMLFFEVYKEQNRVAYLFIRNSGTEDKASCVIACLKAFQDVAKQLAKQIHINMFLSLKLESTQEVEVQKNIILDCLRNQGANLADFTTPLERRVVYETEHKEKLICKTKQGYVLSEIGTLLQERKSFLFSKLD